MNSLEAQHVKYQTNHSENNAKLLRNKNFGCVDQTESMINTMMINHAFINWILKIQLHTFQFFR
jgi:hypothetical protein